tara:strand:- start:4837 stop:5466 length:630 start_codon:yes stop_codon:yes gene_type:complete
MKEPLHVTANAYNELANSYEKRWGKYLSHTYQKMAASLELKGAVRVCDISCGTGLFAHQLIKKYPELELLQLNDISTKMISYAKTRFSKDEHVLFSKLPAHKIDDIDSRFDALISLNAFHNYDKQKAVVNASYNALIPGGKVYILDWNRAGLFKLINFFIGSSVKEGIDTRSLLEMEKLLKKANFDVVNTEKWNWRYWNFFLIVGQKPR